MAEDVFKLRHKIDRQRTIGQNLDWPAAYARSCKIDSRLVDIIHLCDQAQLMMGDHDESCAMG